MKAEAILSTSERDYVQNPAPLAAFYLAKGEAKGARQTAARSTWNRQIRKQQFYSRGKQWTRRRTKQSGFLS